MGAGAVACYFGGMPARAGLPVTLIARQTHRDAIARDGLTIESFRFAQPECVRVAAAADAEGVRRERGSVLCEDRGYGDSGEGDCAASGAHAVVVSMQNGMDNVERIREASGIDALGAAVYVAAEMTVPDPDGGESDALCVGKAAGKARLTRRV